MTCFELFRSTEVQAARIIDTLLMHRDTTENQRFLLAKMRRWKNVILPRCKEALQSGSLRTLNESMVAIASDADIPPITKLSIYISILNDFVSQRIFPFKLSTTTFAACISESEVCHCRTSVEVECKGGESVLELCFIAKSTLNLCCLYIGKNEPLRLHANLHRGDCLKLYIRTKALLIDFLWLYKID